MTRRRESRPSQVRPLAAERRRARLLLVLAAAVLLATAVVVISQGLGYGPWS